MVFGIYCRKSVLTDKGESVENQMEICRNYIFGRFGEENEIKVYEDEGYSGKNTSRPMFIQLTEDIKKQKLDYVVCYRLDRVSRSVSDFSAFVELLNRHKTELICVREEFDTSRPVGKAMMYMASVFSQLERETIGERVKDNMLMLAKGGRWLGGNTPLGYDSVKRPYCDANGRTKTAVYLKRNDDIETVRKIYSVFMGCGNCKKTAEKINRLGLKTSRGGPFTASSIRDIITNPVYCRADKEAFEYFENSGREICGDISDNGLTAYNKGAGEGEVIAVGKHKWAVSGKLWTDTQRMLGGKSTVCLSRGKALASGVIICQNCGGRMYAVIRSGGREFDYICKNKRNKGDCHIKNLKGSEADGKIAEYINLSGDIYEDKLNIRRSLKILWDGKNLKIERLDSLRDK